MWKLKCEVLSSDVIPSLPPTVLILIGAVMLGGCDGGASKRDSLYSRLVGTWTPERIQVDGADFTSGLDRRYETFRLTFTDDQGQRRYQLVGVTSEDTMRVEGPVELVTADVLRMASGFGRPIIWDVHFGEFSDSVEFRLTDSRRVGSEAFLGAIFPDRSWGDAQRVTLRLLRERE